MYDEDDDDEDEVDTREEPDAEDADWNLEPDTIACPYCRAEISEDASRCPKCGEYVSQEDAPAGKRPVWVWVGLVVLLLIILTWIL